MTEPGLVPREASMETLTRLMGRIVHDFNNPLAAIIGFSDLLRSPNLSEEKRQRFIQRIHEQALRLGQLVETMAHYANMPSPDLAAIDLQRTITDFVAIRQSGLDAMKIAFEVQIEPGLPRTMGECGLVSRILHAMQNNLEQIFKENPDMPRRGCLHAFTLDGEVLVELMDSGPGVALEMREQIFEPFVSTRRAGGLGLGLTVGRALARRMGGDLLAVEPSHPDYPGACFRFTLRKAT